MLSLTRTFWLLPVDVTFNVTFLLSSVEVLLLSIDLLIERPSLDVSRLTSPSMAPIPGKSHDTFPPLLLPVSSFVTVADIFMEPEILF